MDPEITAAASVTLDCDHLSAREINSVLRSLPDGAAGTVTHPRGRHNLAVGLTEPVSVTVDGNAGYFVGGLCGARDGTGPDIVVNGFVGWSVGENLMGGSVRVRGSASQSAGASARGGTIVIEGDASLRAGISLKGASLAIGGNAGAMTGFMAQSGVILIGGDAGHGLGDSLYEAVIYVAGSIDSL
jgi:methylamine---glutamate N-methyltransferase subunit B